MRLRNSVRARICALGCNTPSIRNSMAPRRTTMASDTTRRITTRCGYSLGSHSERSCLEVLNDSYHRTCPLCKESNQTDIAAWADVMRRKTRKNQNRIDLL